LTSQDINSLALTRQVRGAVSSDIFPAIREMIGKLSVLSDRWLVFTCLRSGLIFD